MAVIYIKNMVCDRCVMAVKQLVETMGFHPEQVVLGEVKLMEHELSAVQLERLDASLNELGFARIDNHKARLIEAIKSKVILLIHHANGVDRKFNWSTILAEDLHYEYNYLSSLFSSVVGITLEQYIIRQKIEKVKELLFYDELTLSEIADRLGYSSVAHLSGQFKKMTGLTPSELKKSRIQDQQRKPIDGLA